MKLTYKILWFDDTEEFFKSIDFEPLEDDIRQWGFEPSLELVVSPEKLLKRAPFKEYDLIVIDYYLEEHGYGQDFIEKIRQNEVYTEIIFYSANPANELWDAVREKELEGIFIANRQTVITKIVSVANQSVKKVLDLENMRGIVMAEVGDIDHILESIIEQGLAGLDNNDVSKICRKFHSDSKNQVTKQLGLLEEFGNAPSVAGLISLCTDSSKRWNNFERLAKKHPALKGNNVGNYSEDVLKPRNFLAHGKPRINEEGGYIFTHFGREYQFNEETGQELRTNILHYKKVFSDINSELQQS